MLDTPVRMMSRGEVALVIAAAGLSQGVIDGAVFSAAVMMALVTTIATPIFLKLTYISAKPASKRESESAMTLRVEEAGG